MTDWLKYQEAYVIFHALKYLKISFTILPMEEYLKPAFYHHVIIHVGKQSFKIPINNEFEDVQTENPAVLFQFVLMEIQHYEEAVDFLVWYKDVGKLGSMDLSLQIYKELGEVVPFIRLAIGDDIQPVSTYDVHLNTGLMKVLRNWES